MANQTHKLWSAVTLSVYLLGYILEYAYIYVIMTSLKKKKKVLFRECPQQCLIHLPNGITMK